jgi:hypothetical protein
MTKPLAASPTSWRRLIVDALTVVAGLALAFAAVNGTSDVLPQVLLAALLMATAAMMEPQPTVLRRSDRRPPHSAQPSAMRA